LIELKESQKNASAGKEILAQHLTQGIVHFAFEVADVDATATVLRARGMKFACEPTKLAELISIAVPGESRNGLARILILNS